MGAVGFTSGDPRKLDRSGYAKGDVVAADASGVLTPVPVGADTQVLTADSTDPEGVDWQPGGGGGGGGTPSNTVVAETTYGQASNAGAAADYSRGDHTHGTPALTATPPATTLAIGQPAAVGVAATPARADHVHPVADSGMPTTSAVGDTAAQGAATTFARSDHTHGREGFGLPADSLVGDTQNGGVAATVARSDHRHAREPFGPVTPQTAFGEPSSDGAATSVARSDHTHGTPAAPSVPSASGTVVAETSYGQASNAGAATAYARGDHTHGSPSLTSTTPAAETIGATGVVGVATTPARADHLHEMPGAGTPGSSAVGDSPTAGSAGTFARSDHTHGRESFGAVTAQTTFGAASSNGAAITVSRSDHAHGTPAAPTPASIGAVPTSRTISTTAPLTGGGDLSADRTFGVDVGTAAGTVAAGDDARITGAQQRSTLTTKGDLYAATASATVARQPVGVDGQVLTADSTQATGMRWAAASGGGSVPVFARAYITSGDFAPGNDPAFTPLAGLSLSIPAVSGDNVELAIRCMIRPGATSDFYDPCILVSGAAVRYASTGTGTPSTEGDVSMYPAPNNFRTLAGVTFSLVVQPGDLDGGNVVFGVAHIGPADNTTRIYANTTHTFFWRAVNYGQ